MLIDTKNKKLLYELDFGSRKRLKEIAGALRTSPEVVYYRIRKMEQENLITRYMIMLSLSKLGMKQYKIYFKFENFTKEAERKIFDYLENSLKIIWVTSCVGRWDAIIAVLVKTPKEFDTIKSEIQEFLSTQIAEMSISNMVEAVTYRRAYLVTEKFYPKDQAILMTDEPEVKLDKTDMDILKQLGVNGKLPSVEIAQKIGITPRIVAYRIKQMEKAGIILGCKVALNYEKTGILFFKAFIKLKNPVKTRIKDFINYCRTHPNIIHYVKVIGDWDLEPEFEVGSSEELYAILRDIKDRFPDIIKTIETSLITEHKFTYFGE